MSSRALSLATVLLLIGFGPADTVLAQATNLEAGKTPSQIFSQTCTACHKSPRGLLKSVAPGSLPGFLRQHYTTSSDMAGILASYLISNGAADTRYQAKDGKDKKDGAKDKDASSNPEHQGRGPRAQDAAKPDGEAAPAAEGARQRRAVRTAEEGTKPEGQAAPEGRKGKRRAKPGTEEAPKVDAAAPATEEKKSEPKPESKPEPKPDEAKPDSSKSSEKPTETKPESANVEPRGNEAPALRPDPVPTVTAAPPAAAKPAEPAAPKPPEEAAPKPAAPAANSEPAAKPQQPAPPATAAAPPAAPAESSGPPAPPISR